MYYRSVLSDLNPSFSMMFYFEMRTEESEDGGSFSLSEHSCLLEWMTKQTRPSGAVAMTTHVILSPVRIKQLLELNRSASKTYPSISDRNSFTMSTVSVSCVQAPRRQGIYTGDKRKAPRTAWSSSRCGRFISGAKEPLLPILYAFRGIRTLFHTAPTEK
jgi:hypothetical protein